MLIFGLIAALCLYVWLYWIWDSAQVQFGRTPAFFTTLNHMLLAPEGAVFVIFRGLLLLAIFYIFCDFLYATARGKKRKK